MTTNPMEFVFHRRHYPCHERLCLKCKCLFSLAPSCLLGLSAFWAHMRCRFMSRNSTELYSVPYSRVKWGFASPGTLEASTYFLTLTSLTP